MTRAAGNQAAINAANKLAADRPLWQEPTVANESNRFPPRSVSAGVATQGALRTWVCIEPRSVAYSRTAIIGFDTFVGGETYKVTLNNGDELTFTDPTVEEAIAILIETVNEWAALEPAPFIADPDPAAPTTRARIRLKADATRADHIAAFGAVIEDFSVGVGRGIGATGIIYAKVDIWDSDVTFWGLPKASTDLTDAATRPASWVVLRPHEATFDPQADGSLQCQGRGRIALIESAPYERIAVSFGTFTKMSTDSNPFNPAAPAPYTEQIAPRVWIGPSLE